MNKSIKDFDFNYCGVEIGYQLVRNCTEACKSHCSCAKIVSSHVAYINYAQMALALCEGNNDDYKLYAINRCLVMNKVCAADFRVNIAPGFYGEEIVGVCLTNYEIIQKLDELLSYPLETPAAWMGRTLTAEFGELGRQYYSYNWQKVFTNISDIIIPINRDNIISQMEECKKRYQDYMAVKRLPICVCLTTSNPAKYKLLDGYHRLYYAMTQYESTVAQPLVPIFLGSKR